MKLPSVQPRTGHRLDAAAVQRISGCLIEGSESFTYVDHVSTLDRLRAHSLVFVRKFNPEVVGKLEGSRESGALFVLPPEFDGAVNAPRLITADVQSVYSMLTVEIYDYLKDYWTYSVLDHTTAAVHPSTQIMPGSYVGRNVTIGARCLIMPGVVIGPNCSIGGDVLIKSNTVIGQPGFGIFRDRSGLNRHLPHVGGVAIDDDVELGALNTIVAGTIHPTTIGGRVKTDDHVHIAHNCQIGAGTQIAAHAEISGSVVVGNDVWLGPSTSITHGIAIGDKAYIALGSNILSSVEPGERMLGFTAKKISKK